MSELQLKLVISSLKLNVNAFIPPTSTYGETQNPVQVDVVFFNVVQTWVHQEGVSATYDRLVDILTTRSLYALAGFCSEKANLGKLDIIESFP